MRPEIQNITPTDPFGVVENATENKTIFYCKNCCGWRASMWFDNSKNSDTGKFPFCRNCVNRLTRKQVRQYAHYWSTANKINSLWSAK